jgi:glutathione S-transferase
VRELMTFIDLHLELVARELYPQGLLRRREGRRRRQRACARSWRRTSPASSGWRSSRPTVAGDTFTMADCAAFVSVPLVPLVTKLVYGEDLICRRRHRLEALQPLVGERPSAQRVAGGPQGGRRRRREAGVVAHENGPPEAGR